MFNCFCCKKRRPKTIMDRINKPPSTTNFFGCKMGREERATKKEMISDIFKDLTKKQETQPQ